MRNLHKLRSSDSNISMNHDMTKNEREWTKHLVDKARDMSKQEHLGNGFTKYEVLHGRRNSKILTPLFLHQNSLLHVLSILKVFM